MRADRLLSLLWILNREGRPLPAAALARELEVSPRTILRDVEALSFSGVPVYCERGRHGGVALLPGFRPVVTGLTPDEAFALFAVTSVATASTLGIAGPATTALRKISAALPEAARPGSLIAANRLVIDPQGWLSSRRQPWLEEALGAVADSLVVELGYHPASSGDYRQLRVTALGLLCAGTTWYLAGAPDSRPVHFYRLDRIASLAQTAERDPRPDFDLAAAWQEARARFRTRFTPLVAELELSASALATLRGLAALTVHGTETGWMRVTAEFSDLSHATEVLPRVADGLRVLAPEALATELRRLAAALAKAAGDG